MNIAKLNNIQLEYLDQKEINDLIIESRFPNESKQYRFITNPKNKNRFPVFVSNNDLR